MQLLTESPRDGLSAAQVRALFAGPAATVVGAEVLDHSLNIIADVSDYLGAGSIKHDNGAAIHGTCSFDLDTALAWGTALVRPWSTLTRQGVTGKFYGGAYSLATPTTTVGEPFAVTGYDRLHLLDRYLPDTYFVAAGSDVLTAVQAAITAAGLPAGTLLLDTTAAGKVTPADKSWPLLPVDGAQGGYTWLNVVNDLLAMIAYRGLWCDWLGRYRSGPYVDPSARGAEWSIDATSELSVLVGQARSLEQDTWDLPNQWTYYQRNPASGVAPLVYAYTDTAGVAKRDGLLWPAQPVALDAVDQATLTAQAQALIAADQRAAATLTYTGSPWPLVGHADVYALSDPELGVVGKVAGMSWTQPWSAEGLLGDVSHSWQLVG